MPIYRCFCLTADGRIITGAHLEAESVQAVLLLAKQHWQCVPGFRQVEVWHGSEKMVPAEDTQQGTTPIGQETDARRAVQPRPAGQHPAGVEQNQPDPRVVQALARAINQANRTREVARQLQLAPRFQPQQPPASTERRTALLEVAK